MDRRDFIKASVFGIAAAYAGSSKKANSFGRFSSVGTLNDDGGFSRISDNLWIFRDTCNVYVVKQGERGVAIDFGSGKWLKNLDKTGVKQLDHVFLTHHHADQCCGLSEREDWPFIIHAPAGEEKFLNTKYRNDLFYSKYGRGCPDSYSIPESGIAGIKYDMRDSGDFFWERQRIRFIHTPGHGANACSIIADAGTKQVVFCGDAAYEGGTIWQPFHLEWDHYTARGVLAAWNGIKQLINLRIDLLCPSHGPVVSDKPNEKLMLLADKLMDFYDSKIYVSPNEKDNYLEPHEIILQQENQRKIEKIFPQLYRFGMNGYLLISKTGKGLIVDPYQGDMELLKGLLENKLPEVKLDAAVVSHYHLDHCNAAGYLQKSYGVKLYLHPKVQEPLADVKSISLPWLPPESIIADQIWPEEGGWKWNEYDFKVGHYPGQTWWHCGFMTEIDSKKVFFGGDNFHPNSRWDGYGGYCAYNGSRFKDGFVRGAELVLKWRPDVLANGHGVYYYFSASKFQKIIKWAQNTEKVITKLCATGDIEKDYYSLGLKPQDFIGRMPKANASYAWI